MKSLAASRFVEIDQPAGGRAAYLLGLLVAIGCGSSLSGGTGGSGGTNASGGSGGTSACSQSTQPAGTCCRPAPHDPLVVSYVCDEGAGTWACPVGAVPTTPDACTIPGTGGAGATGGAAASGGTIGGGGASGSGGAVGGGGGGACAQSAKPAGFCCVPAQDPNIQYYICDASTGSWKCPPGGSIPATYQSDCLRAGTGGTGSGGVATGGNGNVGSGGAGGIGGHGGAGGLSGHAGASAN